MTKDFTMSNSDCKIGMKVVNRGSVIERYGIDRSIRQNFHENCKKWLLTMAMADWLLLTGCDADCDSCKYFDK